MRPLWVSALLLGSPSPAVGFGAVPVTVRGPQVMTSRGLAAITMADDDKPSFALPSLSTALLGLITVQSAYQLTSDIPGLMSESPDYVGTVFNTAFLAYATSRLLKEAGLFKSDYYAALEGAEVASFAREAAEYALAGEVPSTSKDGLPVATFAGGCFWGTGALLPHALAHAHADAAAARTASPHCGHAASAPSDRRSARSACVLAELHFQRLPGVVRTCVGYTQGNVERPSYEQVCSGMSGHTEGLQLTYDPTVVSYDELCDKLLAVLGTDATVLNTVGNDRGTQ
jgi:peptide methionine sulfoxide reductase MsrA